uniref:Gustatory receptor n=1 Tax=Anopheles melas TaxID=34690 RepID=A0A182TJ68_9DIPT
MDKPFLLLYITSCAFMYVDLAMELVLGLCDCLLLIVRLQLQRLVCSARNLGRNGNQEDDFLTFYGTMYCKIAVILSDHLGPYFGLIILMHCSYVCFEAAICILDMQRDRLAAVLNTLRQNELSLIDLTGSVTDYRVVKLLSTVQLSYGQAKWFGRMMQYESIACCLLLSAGYTILYSFQPEAWYLYLTIASDELAIAPEQISPILWDVYDRVTIHVRKDLSQYCGPIVVLFTSLFVLECAISLVDLGGLLYDGSDLDMSLIAVGALWLLFDFKKFIVPLLLSECLKQKVSIFSIKCDHCTHMMGNLTKQYVLNSSITVNQ